MAGTDFECVKIDNNAIVNCQRQSSSVDMLLYEFVRLLKCDIVLAEVVKVYVGLCIILSKK